jgi:chromosomal replication initiation ATPase DnaA
MSPTEVIRRHAYEHEVLVVDVLGTGRRRELVRARQAVALELRGSGYSLPEIGRHLGRHHTTILYLLRRGPVGAPGRPRKQDWRVGLGL